MTTSSDVLSSQIEVYFKPLNEEDVFQCPSESFVIPTNIRRKGISQLLNQLMNVDPPQAFDILINKQFLRNSLQSYLTKLDITAETAITLYYTKATTAPTTRSIGNKQREWIATVTAPSQTITLTGDYNGDCNIYFLNESGVLKEPNTFHIEDAAITAATSFVDKQSNGKQLGAVIGLKNCDVYFSSFSVNDSAEECVLYNTVRAKGHTDAIQCVATNSDGSTVATSGWDMRILLWDNASMLQDMWEKVQGRNEGGVPNGKKRRAHDDQKQPKLMLNGHSATVMDLCFSQRSDATFYSASLDGSIRCWDMLSGSEVCAWTFGKPVLSMSESPTAAAVCTSHEDGQVKIWDIRSQDGVASNDTSLSGASKIFFKTKYHSHTRSTPCVRWNPYSDVFIASVSHDGTFKLYDIRSLDIPLHTVAVREEDDSTTKLLSCAWSSVNTLMTGGSDGVLRQHSMQ